MSRLKELKRKASFIKRRGVQGILEALGLRKKKDDSIAGLSFIMRGQNGSSGHHSPPVGTCGSSLINWYISEPPASSWVYDHLFSLISRLDSQLFENRVCLFDSRRFRSDPDGFTAFLRDRYPSLSDRCSIISDASEAPQANIAIATDWKTAYEVNRIPYSVPRYYFLDAYEAMKYPAGSRRCFVENTYDMGLNGIVLSPYVKECISKHHDMSLVQLPFGFASDSEHRGKKMDDTPRVAFFVDREDLTCNYILGMMVLSHLCSLIHEVEIVYLGDEMKSASSPTARSYDLGALNAEEVRVALSQCDCLIYLSTDTPTSLPLEAMTCGVVPVLLRGTNNSWLIPEDAALFVETDARGIANEICGLLRSEAALAQKREAASEFVDGLSWDSAVTRLSEHLLEQTNDQ